MGTEDILALNINHLATMNDNYWEYYYKNLSNSNEKAEVNLSKQLNSPILHRSNLICDILNNPNLDCNDSSIELELSLATNRTYSIMHYFREITEKPIALNKTNIKLHYHRLFDIKADLNLIGLDISSVISPLHIIQYMLESISDPVVLLYELSPDISINKNIPNNGRYQGFFVRKDTADHYFTNIYTKRSF